MLSTLVKTSLPKIPFERIAAEILGKKYALSLVVCSDTLARRMNRTYRKKGYAPNILSFPLGTSSGEIFLNVAKAKREARMMKIGLRARLVHLYVHGCLHLKGFNHGERMEAVEKQILKQFQLL